MPLIRADVVGAVGSRICHDLVSPLGAIANALELLQMTGQDDSPEMQLVAESVAHANARIRLFRLAFGLADGDHAMAGRELAGLMQGFGEVRRLRIDAKVPEEVPRDTARLGVLILLCCESLLPWGGTVILQASPRQIAARIAGERMREPEGWVDQLIDPSTALPPASEIHFPLARIAAEGMGRQIEIERIGGDIRVTA